MEKKFLRMYLTVNKARCTKAHKGSKTHLIIIRHKKMALKITIMFSKLSFNLNNRIDTKMSWTSIKPQKPPNSF